MTSGNRVADADEKATHFPEQVAILLFFYKRKIEKNTKNEFIQILFLFKSPKNKHGIEQHADLTSSPVLPVFGAKYIVTGGHFCGRVVETEAKCARALGGVV